MKASRVMWCIAALALTVVLGTAAFKVQAGGTQAGQRSGLARVLSATELSVDGTKIRLAGIAPPPATWVCELHGPPIPCLTLAAAALKDLTAGATVTCETATRSIEAPTTHRCWSDGYDLAEGMAYSGWAIALHDAGHPYAFFETDARENGRGMWRGSIHIRDKE